MLLKRDLDKTHKNKNFALNIKMLIQLLNLVI